MGPLQPGSMKDNFAFTGTGYGTDCSYFLMVLLYYQLSTDIVSNCIIFSVTVYKLNF